MVSVVKKALKIKKGKNKIAPARLDQMTQKGNVLNKYINTKHYSTGVLPLTQNTSRYHQLLRGGSQSAILK